MRRRRGYGKRRYGVSRRRVRRGRKSKRRYVVSRGGIRL